MTTVVNKRKHPYDIYIGRGSKWGNPFEMKNYSKEERDRVCEEYKVYIDSKIAEQPKVYNIAELKDKVLGCYCKPLRCHGDYLAELANRLESD